MQEIRPIEVKKKRHLRKMTTTYEDCMISIWFEKKLQVNYQLSLLYRYLFHYFCMFCIPSKSYIYSTLQNKRYFQQINSSLQSIFLPSNYFFHISGGMW